MIKTGEINSETLSQILNLDEDQQQTVIEELALAPDNIAYDILFFLMNTMGPPIPFAHACINSPWTGHILILNFP